MEQFVLVPLSVYNSRTNSTIVTKQELPRYKPEQSPTYRKDTLKREINQQLSTSASPLVNKKLESPHIKLSDSNTLILDGIETGMLLKDFAQRLKRKNVPLPDIYFTLLDAASIIPDIVANSHANGKERGARFSFSFRKLNDKSCKDFTRKVLQHMVLCAIWQKQRNSPRQR